MNRRVFAGGAAAWALSLGISQRVGAASTSSADPEKLGTPLRVGGVVHADQVLFVEPSSRSHPLPMALEFIGYAFADDDKAREGFATILQLGEAQIRNAAAGLSHDIRVDSTSVGKLGDDRGAFQFKDAAAAGFIAVRVGQQVLTAIPVGADTTIIAAAAQITEDYLDSISDPTEPITPTIDDMPAGWTIATPIVDVTLDAQPAK